MSTFFEIFNKVLLELNYRTVESFEDIYKSEHIKILDCINRVNEEVLSSFEWPFLLRKEILKPENPLKASGMRNNSSQISTIFSNHATEGGKISTTTNTGLSQISTINLDPADQTGGSQISTIGEILDAKINPACIPLAPCVCGLIKTVYQGNRRLLYFQNLENALQKGLPINTYTVCAAANPINSKNAQNPQTSTQNAENPSAAGSNNSEIQTDVKPSSLLDYGVRIFVNGPRDKEYTVYYYSKDTALGANGEFKTKMDAGDDVSILPMPWAEHILLYGTCLKVKANPAYPKFGFWNTMYIQALANLQKKGTSAAEDAPFLSIVSKP